MSFDLSFYRDQLLNKLGEYKDRNSAVLRTLDNCQVKLKVTTTTTNDDRMPYKIRGRSKSKCKHSHTHEMEKVYRPRRRSYSPDWDSDSDSECAYAHRDPYGGGYSYGCGRSPCRLPFYVDGEGSPFQQNVNQQNINVLPSSHGTGGHQRGRRSPSRGPPILVENPGQRIGRGPRHGFDPLSHCPHGGHRRRPHHHAMMAQGGYTPITNDDGKVDIYNNAKLLNRFKEFADTCARQKKEKEVAAQKKQDDTAEIINKLFKPAASSPTWMWPGEYERSAGEIRSELERVNADMDQLRSRASMMALNAAAYNEAEVMADRQAMCSGALQDGTEQETAKCKKQERLTSMLARPRKVDFANHVDCTGGHRVEEVNNEDSEGYVCDCC